MAKNAPRQDQRDELYAPDEPEQLVSLNIRVPMDVRTEFMEVCQTYGTTMTKVLRKFIEREIANNKS